MKKYLIFILFILSTSAIYSQKFDYNALLKNQFLSNDSKTGLQLLLNGRQLADVIERTTAEARDTLNRYHNALINAHLEGPYNRHEFDIKLSKTSINLDAGFKAAAKVLGDVKMPEGRRIAALQIIFGLNRLMYEPIPIEQIEPRDEFIKHDVFLEWKNRNSDHVSLTALQLYDAYKLGLRLAQSKGNKQLTNYFRSKQKVDAIGWITDYLSKAFYIPPKGEIRIDEPVDGPRNDKMFEPGEKEPLYTMMAAHSSFPGGYNQFYQVMFEHLQYPAEEWDRGIEGEVYIYFDVEKDGSISHFKVSQPFTPGIDSAITRAGRYLPKLIPGHLQSSTAPVRTFQVYAINFVIQPGKSREDAFKPPFIINSKTEDKIKPETPGHKRDLFHYINKNSTYQGPPFGSITLSYTIQVSGEVTDIRVLKHLSPAADSEAVKLLKQAPFWAPGALNKPRKMTMRDTISVYMANRSK